MTWSNHRQALDFILHPSTPILSGKSRYVRYNVDNQTLKPLHQVPRCFQWNNRCGPPACCHRLFFNPEGIGSLSPGLARFREGLPWVATVGLHNPERVASHALTRAIQPLQGCAESIFSPRVARSSQPWADRFNPFGIELGHESYLQRGWHSTEISEEP